MSVESVKEHFKQWNREQNIMEFDTTSAPYNRQLIRLVSFLHVLQKRYPSEVKQTMLS